MALVFPSNPSVNDTYQVNGRIYVWNGTSWRTVKGGVPDVVPTLTVDNDFSAGGTLHIDSTNNEIGIGTAAPSHQLHLTQDLGVDGNLIVGGTITVPTPVAGTNDTKVATTAFVGDAVSTAVSGLLDGAPAALDTLNELAAALDDDASYAATITTALAGKLDSSSYTAADVLAKLITVDGAGSSLDADTLDGSHASAFAASAHTHSYLPLTGGTVTGQTTFSATDGVKITGSVGGIYFEDRNGDGSRYVMYHQGSFFGIWDGAHTHHQFHDDGHISITDGGDSNYIYFGPNGTWGGQLYVGATSDKAGTNTAAVISTDGNLHIDVADGKTMYLNYYTQGRPINVYGDIVSSYAISGSTLTATGNITGNGFYASDWFRTYGEEGLYSSSYGQHFYPDAGGFLWDLDGPLRVRDGYEGGIQGYLGYHDANGFGLLHSGGSWWLNTQNNYKTLTIGGSQALNAHSSDTGFRLMLGGGDADAQSNYYIGTNMENYGGNYNKLDMFWHTGIRMAAMRQYGGIRMYGSITGGALSDELFSVGKGDGNVRTTNSLIAGGSIAVTRPQAIHLNGISDNNHKIYSVNAADTELPWSDGPVLVGHSGWAMYDEQYDIWRMGVRGSNSSGVRYGWYNCNLIVGNQPDDTLNTHRLRVQGTGYFTDELQTANKLNANLGSNQQWWGGTVLANPGGGRATFVMHPGGVAPQFIGVQNDGTVYLRNSVDSAYRALAAIIYDQSSVHSKQDIVSFPSKITSPAGSAVDPEYFPTATDLVNKLRPVYYRWKQDQDLDQVPTGRRLQALLRLQKYNERNGRPFYTGPDLVHECGRDCDHTKDDPCNRVKNWMNGKIGLIAQEVGEVVPECANIDFKSGEYESLDGPALSALCIAAIQEVDKRINMLEALESRIAALEAV